MKNRVCNMHISDSCSNVNDDELKFTNILKESNCMYVSFQRALKLISELGAIFLFYIIEQT